MWPATLSSLKTPPPEWGFSRIARATLRATMDPTKAPSAPLHADPPVLISRPGVCGFCGLGTAFACPQCITVHFCSAGCLAQALEVGWLEVFLVIEARVVAALGGKQQA